MSFPSSKLEADKSFSTVTFEFLKTKFDNVVATDLIALALQTFTGKIGFFTVNNFAIIPPNTVFAFIITHPGARRNQFVLASLETAGEVIGSTIHLQTATVSANGSILFNIRNASPVTTSGIFVLRIKYILIDP